MKILRMKLRVTNENEYKTVMVMKLGIIEFEISLK
jgi:hypothetical protein